MSVDPLFEVEWFTQFRIVCLRDSLPSFVQIQKIWERWLERKRPEVSMMAYKRPSQNMYSAQFKRFEMGFQAIKVYKCNVFTPLQYNLAELLPNFIPKMLFSFVSLCACWRPNDHTYFLQILYISYKFLSKFSRKTLVDFDPDWSTSMGVRRGQTL